MRQRYFLIEPQFSDPDTFCHITVGSDRVRASIHVYADSEMLFDVCQALEAEVLTNEWPAHEPVQLGMDGILFGFQLSVLPHEGLIKLLRICIFQDWLDDGAPFRTEIQMRLCPAEALVFAKELREWCNKPTYSFVWNGD